MAERKRPKKLKPGAGGERGAGGGGDGAAAADEEEHINLTEYMEPIEYHPTLCDSVRARGGRAAAGVLRARVLRAGARAQGRKG
jgi:hypothetical protein